MIDSFPNEYLLRQASLMNKVENIPDSSFLLIHGTADDNVHVQHTMMLTKHLVQNHIIFRQQVRGTVWGEGEGIEEE